MTTNDIPAKTRKPRPLQAFFCVSCNDPETSEIVFAKSNVAARRIHTNSQGTDFDDAKITRKKEFDQYAPGPVPPQVLLNDGWYFDCTGCGRTLNFSDDDMWVDGEDVDELMEMADHNARIDVELAEFDRLQAEAEKAAEEEARENPTNRPSAGSIFRHLSPYDTPKFRRAQIESRKYDPLIDPKALRFIGQDTFCHVVCQQNHYAHIAKINISHEAAEIEAQTRFPEGRGFESKRYPYLEPRVEFRVDGLEYPVHWDPKEPDSVRVTNADKEAWQELISRRETLQTA